MPDADWRVIFLVQAGLAMLTILLVLATYPTRVRPAQSPRAFDLAGMDWMTVFLLAGGHWR